MPHEVGHLTARDACRNLDERDSAVGRGDQLRERDPVAQAESGDGALGLPHIELRERRRAVPRVHAVFVLVDTGRDVRARDQDHLAGEVEPEQERDERGERGEQRIG